MGKQSKRKQAPKLPTALSAWEVAWIPREIDLGGVRIEGVLVVVEASTGLLRTLAPVPAAGLKAAMAVAIREPQAPAVACEPVRLRVRDPEFAARLRMVVRAPVDVVDQTPAVDELLGELDQLGADTFTDIAVEHGRWREALAAFERTEPWMRCTVDFAVRFEGAPALDEAVAILVGGNGEEPTIALFPNAEEYLRALDAMDDDDGDALSAVDQWSVMLWSESLCSEEVLADAMVHGLRLPSGAVPRLTALQDGAPVPLGEAEQRVLLAAVEAVVAVVAPPRFTGRQVVDTVLGPVTAVPTPDRYAGIRLLGRAAQREGVAQGQYEGRPLISLVHEFARAEGLQELEQELQGMDSVQLWRRPDGVMVIARRGEEELGAFAFLDPDLAADLAGVLPGGELGVMLRHGSARPRVTVVRVVAGPEGEPAPDRLHGGAAAE